MYVHMLQNEPLFVLKSKTKNLAVFIPSIIVIDFIHHIVLKFRKTSAQCNGAFSFFQTKSAVEPKGVSKTLVVDDFYRVLKFPRLFLTFFVRRKAWEFRSPVKVYNVSNLLRATRMSKNNSFC